MWPLTQPQQVTSYLCSTKGSSASKQYQTQGNTCASRNKIEMLGTLCFFHTQIWLGSLKRAGVNSRWKGLHMVITAWDSLSEFQSNPFMVHSDGEWQDKDSLLPRVFFSPWIPAKSQIMDRRQTRKSVNSVLWPVFLPFWHSPFCWPLKLLLQTSCIMEGPLHFLGLRMTVLHIPGAITAENLLEEKTRSSLETTPSISTFQGWCFTGKFFIKRS